MESNKDANWPSPEEAKRVKAEARDCACGDCQDDVQAFQVVEGHLFWRSMMVAAGGARATGLDKHSAVDMFLTFYNDATNFMMEE
jgi:hypothetical protein